MDILFVVYFYVIAVCSAKYSKLKEKVEIKKKFRFNNLSLKLFNKEKERWRKREVVVCAAKWKRKMRILQSDVFTRYR